MSSRSTEREWSNTTDYTVASVAAILAIIGAPIAFFSQGLVTGLVLTTASLVTATVFLVRQDIIPRTILSIVPGYRPSNPQDIKEHYTTRRARIRRNHPLRTPYQSDEQTKFWANRSKQLEKLADRYLTQADMYWGRTSERRQLHAAWSYATSGWIHERAVRILVPDKELPTDSEEDQPRRQSRQAADAYHYAANSFRVAGAYRQSMQYYHKAYYCDLPDSPMKLRSLYRALGVSRLAGDLDHEEEILKEIEEHRKSLG